jgi:hypothetical protein
MVFTGCSEDSNPVDPVNSGGGDPDPVVKTHDNIDITLKKFYVVRDCDGIEGDGEFEFKIQILNSNNTVLYTYTKGGLELGGGDSFTINYTAPITMARTEGNKFRVRFICTEWDRPIIGDPYRDSRMNQQTLTLSHIFSGDKWSNISGIRYMTTNPGSDCSTEFSYTVLIN